MRWARQTVDAILAVRGAVNGWSSLLLANHLLAYLMPIAFISTLALFVIGMGNIDPTTFVEVVITADKIASFSRATATLWVSVLGLIALRLLHWKVNGGTLVSFLQYSILSSAVSIFVSVHIALGVLRSLLVDQTTFVPTGFMRSTEIISVTSLWFGMFVPWCLCMVAVANVLTGEGTASHTGLFLLLMTGCISPFVLWWFHRDQST